MTDTKYEKTESIVIELTTGTSRKSATDDPIELYIGSHDWLLHKPKYDDFEKGKTDVYELDVPAGMDSSWFRYLCFRKKTKSGKDDSWQLMKIKLIINGKVVYEKDKLDAWLVGAKSSYCAPGFSYGRAGE
ncbi:MAG: hypothetical protein FK734_06215 [Asgard group archaeon]|nr:hypothetical protein [Asgard group archaeon]